MGMTFQFFGVQGAGKDGKHQAEVVQFVMMSVKPWNPYIKPANLEGRKAELKKLRLYLKYLGEKAEYVSLKLNAEIALQEKREAHIRTQLRRFEDKERMKGTGEYFGCAAEGSYS